MLIEHMFDVKGPPEALVVFEVREEALAII
jgi:hypothetical protein